MSRFVDLAALNLALHRGERPLDAYRRALQELSRQQDDDFDSGTDIESLVRERAGALDAILRHCWERHFDPDDNRIALVAVGGYGRGELHPHSDIDLLILLSRSNAEKFREPIEAFLTFLWDIGLEVGHSVRSVRECRQAAKDDITIITNLMEARLLAGPPSLMDRLERTITARGVWPSSRFFRAKYHEQQQRYGHFHGSGYRVEPNLKECPGGLRDLQVIWWVAKRHFGAPQFSELVGHGFLSDEEYGQLVEGRAFLWRVRYALHRLTGRREDRLLFDQQLKVAKHLGYTDHDGNRAVEHFMQDYYRTVIRLSRLNELLLQLFSEAILDSRRHLRPQPINNRFQTVRGYLEVTDPDIFQQRPLALLEVFQILQRHPDIKGVRADTIRLIRKHRHLIDDEFRSDIRARSLFLDILQHGRGVTHQLRRMHRYGILGRYIPGFGLVTGLMQFDLFHAYTVDEHTLFVVRNLRHFACPEFNDELPFFSELMQQHIAKPWLLYIAGLFHDIAKGRGGDHSRLGAEEALAFCQDHGLSSYDSDLVAWLVRSHLLMSTTAQRKDISDPEVLHAFADAVGSSERLDYLLLLTVSDIRGTNPELWNSWRESLLMELYRGAKRMLQGGLDDVPDEQKIIDEKSVAALERLAGLAWPEASVKALWNSFGDDYLLRHSVDELVWHANALLAPGARDSLPLVLLDHPQGRGGTTIFVHMADHDFLFGKTATLISQLGLSILDAQIASTDDGHTLDSFIVIEDTGAEISGAEREQEIVSSLRQGLLSDTPPRVSSHRVPRQIKVFDTPTMISFMQDTSKQRTIMELVTGDRPGILSAVGRAFADHGIRLLNAKIVTIGERAEDVFFIDRDQAPITDPRLLGRLRDAIVAALDDGQSA